MCRRVLPVEPGEDLTQAVHLGGDVEIHEVAAGAAACDRVDLHAGDVAGVGDGHAFELTRRKEERIRVVQETDQDAVELQMESATHALTDPQPGDLAQPYAQVGRFELGLAEEVEIHRPAVPEPQRESRSACQIDALENSTRGEVCRCVPPAGGQNLRVPREVVFRHRLTSLGMVRVKRG